MSNRYYGQDGRTVFLLMAGPPFYIAELLKRKVTGDAAGTAGPNDPEREVRIMKAEDLSPGQEYTAYV